MKFIAARVMPRTAQTSLIECNIGKFLTESLSFPIEANGEIIFDKYIKRDLGKIYGKVIYYISPEPIVFDFCYSNEANLIIIGKDTESRIEIQENLIKNIVNVINQEFKFTDLNYEFIKEHYADRTTLEQSAAIDNLLAYDDNNINANNTNSSSWDKVVDFFAGITNNDK